MFTAFHRKKLSINTSLIYSLDLEQALIEHLLWARSCTLGGRADIKYNNQGVVNGVHLQRSLGEQMG